MWVVGGGDGVLCVCCWCVCDVVCGVCVVVVVCCVSGMWLVYVSVVGCMCCVLYMCVGMLYVATRWHGVVHVVGGCVVCVVCGCCCVVWVLCVLSGCIV